MSDRPFTTFATATSNNVLSIDGPASGLQWIIWQLSVETLPFRPGAVVKVLRNGRLVTATYNGGRAAASGPPALKFTNSDTLKVIWDSVQIGDELVCTLLYEETQWGQLGSTFGLV